MKTMFTLTHVGPDGFRRYTLPNRGQYHYVNDWMAEALRDAMIRNNTEEVLKQVHGPHFLETVRVDAVECWDHGDRAGSPHVTMFEYHPDLDLESKDADLRERLAKVILSQGGKIVRSTPNKVVDSGPASP